MAEEKKQSVDIEERKKAYDAGMALSRAKVEAAKADSSGRVYRIYCDGIFDMAHLGHFRMLEQAKKSLGDPSKVWLVCGVCNDEDTLKYKGKVVMNHELRCETMKHCRWVDEVAVDAPWVITDAFMDKYRIDFVAHDALPYQDLSGTSADGDVYGPIKAAGKFLETQRTEGISTSDLIVQIVRDYDDYVLRNLKRGYSKENLNVGRTWELRVIAHEREKKMKQAVAESKEHFKELRGEIKAFISEFAHDIEASGFKFSPSQKPNGNDAHSRGIFYHTLGLARAVVLSGWYAVAYINPLSYCRRPKFD